MIACYFRLHPRFKRTMRLHFKAEYTQDRPYTSFKLLSSDISKNEHENPNYSLLPPSIGVTFRYFCPDHQFNIASSPLISLSPVCLTTSQFFSIKSYASHLLDVTCSRGTTSRSASGVICKVFPVV